ncbi:MAG TPA: cyclic-di-AMP receptor [Anaerolineales bacterium]
MNEKYLKVVRLPDMERGAERIEPSVDRLMFAVVQAQDVRKASRALNAAGLLVAQLTSTGGFLGRRNVTLLIGMRENQEELAVKLIHDKCRQRVEYVSTPLEGAPLPIPVATPVTVGGATVFTFMVEHYEEI